MPFTNFTFFGSTFATKNFIPCSMYGRSSGATSSGIAYSCLRSQRSRPVDSPADSTTTSYSPTENRASTLTLSSSFVLTPSTTYALSPVVDPENETPYSTGGRHGSASQYSTSRGAPS